MGEGVKKIMESAAAGDYASMQQAKNDIKLKSGNFIAEKDDFDKVIKSSESGQTFTPADYRIMYSGKGPTDFQTLVDNNYLTVHEQTGRYVPTAFDNVDLPKYMIDVVGKYKNAPTDRIDALGRQIYETDVAGATNALAYTYDNEPAIKAKYRLLAGNSVVKEGKTKEQYETDLRNKFIEDGLGMIQPSRVVKPSQGNNFNFSFGNGEQDARIATEGNNQAINTTYVDPVSGEMKVGTFTVARFQGVGDKKATMPISAYAYNVETGRPVTTSANEQFVFNGFGDINVLTQDFKVTARNGEVISYEKGAPIPDEYVPYAQKAGAVKKILGAQVKGESGTMVMPADIFMQSAAFDEATSDKEAITAAFNKAKAPYKDGSFSVISGSSNKKPSSKTTQQKSAIKTSTPQKTTSGSKTPTGASTEAKKKKAEEIAKKSGIAPMR
jgi:hypothetical protein